MQVPFFAILNHHFCFTGGTPYAEILPFDLYSQLCGGMRLPKPMHCAQEVYDIVKMCWAKISTERLSFYGLHERLDALAQSKMVSDIHVFSKDCDSSLTFGRVFWTSSCTAMKPIHSLKMIHNSQHLCKCTVHVSVVILSTFLFIILARRLVLCLAFNLTVLENICLCKTC